MRAKELKNFLANIPDDTEILIRCQTHERPPAGTKESVGIASLTPTINDVKHQVVFNSDKNLRTMTWTPELTDMVVCEDCVRCSRIKTCTKRGRHCEGCTAVCECKNCGYLDTDTPKPYSQRPKFEKDPTK